MPLTWSWAHNPPEPRLMLVTAEPRQPGLFFHLYWYRLMGSCYSLSTVIISWCSNCPRCGQRELDPVHFFVLLTNPFILWTFLSAHEDLSGLSCLFPAPVLEPFFPLRIPSVYWGGGVFSGERYLETKIEVSGVFTDPGANVGGVALLLGLLSRYC